MSLSSTVVDDSSGMNLPGHCRSLVDGQEDQYYQHLEYIPALLIPAANRQVWVRNAALIQYLSDVGSTS